MTLVDVQIFIALHPAVSAICAGAVGACIGSFLNAVSYTHLTLPTKA